jgi:uncharacterized protein (DUF1330 family)
MTMMQCLILVKIKDRELFDEYLKGHLPTIAQYGGRVVFRSTENTTLLGDERWDVVVMQEWPSESAFDSWWNSKEYGVWAKLRDSAASMLILKSNNTL